MNNMGKRIKELRKKKDLTQEDLADRLGITHKAVSKWECGVTAPDLSLIVPLARVLDVSTDVLFGMKSPENDERKLYFDTEYFEFWKKDNHEADYQIAKQAVAEYPNDYRYLNWLGTVEYYIAFNFTDQKEFLDMMDSAIKHSLCVYENCFDEQLRNDALWTVICSYVYSDRATEAKNYAMLYPETVQTSRDKALELCLQGEELLVHQQGMISDALAELCSALSRIWRFSALSNPRARAAVEAEKKIIEAIIPDGNTLGFSFTLSLIHEKLAEMAFADQNYDLAISEFEKAIECAAKSDEARVSGKQLYTAPILDHYDYDYSECRPLSSDAQELRRKLSEDNRYDLLRDRESFKALFKE